jgi:hypothetical protein
MRGCRPDPVGAKVLTTSAIRYGPFALLADVDRDAELPAPRRRTIGLICAYCNGRRAAGLRCRCPRFRARPADRLIRDDPI